MSSTYYQDYIQNSTEKNTVLTGNKLEDNKILPNNGLYSKQWNFVNSNYGNLFQQKCFYKINALTNGTFTPSGGANSEQLVSFRFQDGLSDGALLSQLYLHITVTNNSSSPCALQSLSSYLNRVDFTCQNSVINK
jgi:hypothetical protein